MEPPRIPRDSGQAVPEAHQGATSAPIPIPAMRFKPSPGICRSISPELVTQTLEANVTSVSSSSVGNDRYKRMKLWRKTAPPSAQSIFSQFDAKNVMGRFPISELSPRGREPLGPSPLSPRGHAKTPPAPANSPDNTDR